MAYKVTNISGSTLFLGSLELEVGATEEVGIVTPPISAALFNNLVTLVDLGSAGGGSTAISNIGSADGSIVWTQTVTPATPSTAASVTYNAAVNAPVVAAAVAPAVMTAIIHDPASVKITDAFSRPIGTILHY